MRMRIATNYQSLVAQRRLRNAINIESEKNVKLSSGDRISKASYDPAGLAISEIQKAKITSLYQLERNANDSTSILQVAEGTLAVIQENAIRLKELAIKHANDVMGDTDRLVGDLEFQQLKKEAKRLAIASSYNGTKLLDGKGAAYDLQIGLNNNPGQDRLYYNLKNILDPSNYFELGDASITSKLNSQLALSKIDKMTDQVSRGRAELGGLSVRVDSIVTNIQIKRENHQSSRSKIRDTDIARETALRAVATIQKNASVQSLVHANSTPSRVAKLIDA